VAAAAVVVVSVLVLVLVLVAAAAAAAAVVVIEIKTVPWFRRLVAGLSPWKPGFDPGSVHVGFVVDNVALGQVFPRVLRFSHVNFIPPVLH
jgi:hypothetical protein